MLCQCSEEHQEISDQSCQKDSFDILPVLQKLLTRIRRSCRLFAQYFYERKLERQIGPIKYRTVQGRCLTNECKGSPSLCNRFLIVL
jgi:hypothetical protein